MCCKGSGPKAAAKMNEDNLPEHIAIFFDMLSNMSMHDIIMVVMNKFKLNKRLSTLASLATDFESFQELQEALFVKEEEHKRVYIVISTIHKSKGLEFDQVFIPHYDTKDIDKTDENNVFYVAITRAKHALYIC